MHGAAKQHPCVSIESFWMAAAARCFLEMIIIIPSYSFFFAEFLIIIGDAKALEKARSKQRKKEIWIRFGLIARMIRLVPCASPVSRRPEMNNKFFFFFPSPKVESNTRPIAPGSHWQSSVQWQRFKCPPHPWWRQLEYFPRAHPPKKKYSKQQQTSKCIFLKKINIK